MSDKLSPNKELIRELSDLLEETGLTEIEWAEGQTRVRVGRTPGPVAAYPVAAAVAPAAAPAALATAAAEPSHAGHPGAVTSPVVGTAYVAPEPGAEPFIKAGDNVSEGQTLLIVEAMKTMNPIRAPRSGTVCRILVENDAPVEYGEVLLLLQ